MNNEYFEIAYKKYFKVLFYYALRIVSKEAAAEDIVQDVFLEFWKQRRSIDLMASPKPYLYTLTYHKSIDYLRSSETNNISFSHFDTHLDEVFFNIFTSEENLDVRDMEEVIETAIASLPPKCREVFLLSREKGMKNAQIAEILGITPKAVEKHITKALKDIKSALEEKGYFPLWIILLYFLYRGW
ncbi:RNA polymerase sigma-70 factor [Limibacterium fermenti]|jgi:RNA polymerase sigma-70 factor (ECF subfamily)|uniref:RNA polymerase sigma-70 factor n=1 Tax=Limibacterium fermenti TaxID=3229863 RepID=UPI000E805D7E|nr:RNA polymerase sigma-70 factor [Porphyromonadaceae bacterium]HBX21836.1 RNA polymerase sigma-70 factor [Porphyromonadaceae bacterium]HBX44616.1 RNA polymerase sigma-70 factor [Porphyromonadaceae bacterium]HCM21807.1 RNA polymerase sigma-70 factor [Porphyromonadaceae bacterium]